MGQQYRQVWVVTGFNHEKWGELEHVVLGVCDSVPAVMVAFPGAWQPDPGGADVWLDWLDCEKPNCGRFHMEAWQTELATFSVEDLVGPAREEEVT